MTEIAQSPEAVTMRLAEYLLSADGKLLFTKGTNAQAASRSEIVQAFTDASDLVNGIRGQR